MRYAIVIEKAEGNYSAYVPDFPGCVATGATVAEVEAEIREAIVFHVEGLSEDGIPIPDGASQVEYMEVAAQGSVGSFGQQVPRTSATTTNSSFKRTRLRHAA